MKLFRKDKEGKSRSGSAWTCQRCHKETLSRQAFIDTLAQKHNIRLNPGTLQPILSGVFMGGFGAVEQEQQRIRRVFAEVENQRAFRCRSCGKIYCFHCLFNNAPTHANGGKACFSCGGAFEEA